ncbi:MAG: 2-isopropylmalate synthase [Firmicutes bacterium]|nr:2-isopropylmalate synthase [Bacillota bacterium]
MKHITIFDTTLRDGEQSPGASLFPHEKIRVAKQLQKLGVDVIEPGFPASSPGDFAAVEEISRTVTGVEICGFARALRGDIDAALAATQSAQRRRLHLFISSSQIHLDFQLKKGREEVLGMARDMVSYARQFVDRIEFSPMDATRTGDEFLIEMVEAVIAAGATIINLPDTVGYALPDEYERLFRMVRTQARQGETVEYSAHCHNDLGLAVANSMAAIRGGATHIEATINGIGERAGNCSLEELTMAIATRGETLGVVTGIRREEIYATSRLVSRMMNFPIAYNKAIVGRNAFAHEAGIHQDGLLKNRSTYEIMDPEALGIPRSMIVLGKHSGRHALKKRVGEFGVALTDKQLDNLFISFKELADASKRVSDDQLISLVGDTIDVVIDPYSLKDIQVVTSNQMTRVASVTIVDNETGEASSYSGNGEGPVEAIIHCIKQAIPLDVVFVDLELHSIASGETANGEAAVMVSVDGVSYRGVGIDRDVIMAVSRAYMSACNQAVRAHRLLLQEGLPAAN